MVYFLNQFTSLIKSHFRLTSDEGCPEKCSYRKLNDNSNDIWCIGQGDYNFSDICPTSEETTSPKSVSTSNKYVTTLTTEESTASGPKTTIPPPKTPNDTIRIKTQYEENGVIFEQEDSYNNITGEAKIVVPAHGNNSAVEVIMQESTVSHI